MPGHKNREARFEDFRGGIDLREGLISRDGRKFYDQLNVYTTPGRKPTCRPPLIKDTGAYATTLNGPWFVNGLFTFLKAKGTIAAVTLTVPYQVLEWDQPDFCSAGTVIDLVTINDIVVALIKHTFENTTATPGLAFRYFLHVFDGKKGLPTFVQDPACPTNYTNVPLQPYGPPTGLAGGPKEYAARLGVAGNRVFLSMADGNVSYCGVNRPRCWSDRTTEEFLSDGIWYYFMHPGRNTGTTPHFYVTEDYAGLGFTSGYDGWAAFLVEKYDSTLGWVAIPDQAPFATGVIGVTYTNPVSKYNAGYARGVEFFLNDFLPPGTLLRMRLLPKPSVTLMSGGNVQSNGVVSGGTLAFQGANYQFISRNVLSDLDPVSNLFTNYILASTQLPSGARARWGSTIWTGLDRYYGRIIAKINGKGGPPATALALTLTGTMAVAAGSKKVVGTGSLFTTECTVGAIINIIGQIRRITSITSDLILEVDEPFLEAVVAGTLADMGPDPVGSYSQRLANEVGSAIGGGDIAVLSRITASMVANTEDNTMPSAAEVKRLYEQLHTAPRGTSDLDPTFMYASEGFYTGTEFYTKVESRIVVDLAGANDAGFITTGIYDNNGDVPTCLATAQDRLLVFYPNSVQLWQVPPDALQTRLLVKSGIGSGPHTIPVAADVEGYSAVPTYRGPYLFAPDGNNKDYLAHVPVGDLLYGVELPDLKAAAWWPRLNLFLTCGTGSTTTEVTLRVLSYHKSASVMAWSRWVMSGITQIDRIIPANDKLYLAVQGSLYHFDPDASVFKDTNDGAAKFTSRVRWLYNDLGAPGANKKLYTMHLAQVGGCSVKIYVSAAVPADFVNGPSLVYGYTEGLKIINLAGYASVVSFELTSVDQTGWTLNGLSFNYASLKR